MTIHISDKMSTIYMYIFNIGWEILNPLLIDHNPTLVNVGMHGKYLIGPDLPQLTKIVLRQIQTPINRGHFWIKLNL